MQCLEGVLSFFFCQYFLRKNSRLSQVRLVITEFTLQSMLVYSSQKISNHGQLSKNSISAIINHRAAIFSAKWLIIWAIWIRTLSGLITFKTAEKPQQIVVVRSMTMFDRGPLNGSLTVQHQLITSSQQSNSKETSAEIKRDETKSRRQERSMTRREFL